MPLFPSWPAWPSGRRMKPGISRVMAVMLRHVFNDINGLSPKRVYYATFRGVKHNM